MTGFGETSAQVDGAHYAVEVRSLNSKYYKTQIRLPEELLALEAELESALAKRINRGSIVLTIRYADCSANAAAKLNSDAIQRYMQELLQVEGLTHDATRIDLAALLALPGVVIPDTGEERLEQARTVVRRLLDEACEKLLGMRSREGEILHTELHKHRKVIEEHLSVVADRVPMMIDLYQQRLHQRMDALLAESGAAVREEDLIREVAVFAERSDIAEEVSRLQGHLAQFAELIDSESAEPIGRTLDFLAQEMLREANTIGSKCLDVEISRRIVEIKGAIDRIKEQVQNVE
ncbi:MAG: YicC family protein [Phycisphaerales bacterium]|nr:MAG: YicC family protein [Phycisphaerales bacterium]